MLKVQQSSNFGNSLWNCWKLASFLPSLSFEIASTKIAGIDGKMNTSEVAAEHIHSHTIVLDRNKSKPITFCWFFVHLPVAFVRWLGLMYEIILMCVCVSFFFLNGWICRFIILIASAACYLESQLFCMICSFVCFFVAPMYVSY